MKAKYIGMTKSELIAEITELKDIIKSQCDNEQRLVDANRRLYDKVNHYAAALKVIVDNENPTGNVSII